MQLLFCVSFSIITLFLGERRRRRIMSSSNTIHDDSLKHYSMVTKLVHYTSKFELNGDGRYSKQNPSTKSQRSSSNLDLTDKFVYIGKSNFHTRGKLVKKSELHTQTPNLELTYASIFYTIIILNY